jgi:hypothetical protein
MSAVPTRARCAAVPLAALLAFGAAGCTDGGSPKGSASPSVPLATLPAGDLSDRVLQPDEVSRPLVPISAQTGARDITSIAAFSADPKTAKKSLQDHGFQSAYVVQYADPATSAVVTNVVTKFATVEGATADLTADLASSGKTGTVFPVTGLGDQAGGVRGASQKGAAAGTLLTLRWRLGDTTWLLAVGAPKPVDEDGVRGLADRLMTRLAKPSD